ncbi:MAG TPA: beta-xylosidase, partial [Sphingomonas sp.]
MIEAAMIWNEPNNKSHWDVEVDPDWSRYAECVIRAGAAIASINPAITRVLGGMSPIDAGWVTEVGVGSFGAEEVQVFGIDR